MTKVKDVEMLDANRKNDVNGLVCKTDSLTEQQWKDSQDINLIIKNCVGVGRSSESVLAYLASLEMQSGRYLDVSNVSSLEDMQAIMDEAHNSFIENVPASIRDKYNNNPIEFYKAYQADPKAISEMFKDMKNYSVPNVEQVEEAPHINVEKDKKE